MKRLGSVLAIAVVCTTVSYEAWSQNSFAGTVKFAVKYEGDINPQKHVPYEKTYIIFENKVKEPTYGGQRYEIYDGDSLTITEILDLIGYGRFGRVIESETMEEMLSYKTFTYEERADTKTICGYVCKGYNATLVEESEDDDNDDEAEPKEIKYVFYTTKEIGKNDKINALIFPGLSGFPLYIEKTSEGVTEITQATEVKKGKVKLVDFMIPSHCKMCKTAYVWAKEQIAFDRQMRRQRGESDESDD
jgi:hypothetical protein